MKNFVCVKMVNIFLDNCACGKTGDLIFNELNLMLSSTDVYFSNFSFITSISFFVE